MIQLGNKRRGTTGLLLNLFVMAWRLYAPEMEERHVIQDGNDRCDLILVKRCRYNEAEAQLVCPITLIAR